jgi:hypothetical protein
MNELQKKYSLSDSKLKYEEKQATKKGYSLEQWLEYKYDSKELWDSFLDEWDKKDLNIKDTQFIKSFSDSEWFALVNANEQEDGFATLGNRTKDDILSNFFKVQTRLKNKELFWFLFNTFYLNFDFSSNYKDDFIKSFNIHNRLSLSLEERVKWCLHGFLLYGYNEDNKSTRSLLELFDKIKSLKENEDVILYRGFLVGKDERIMDENKKQITGAGFSYSWDKDKAISFALRFNWFEYAFRSLRIGFNRADKDIDKFNQFMTLSCRIRGVIKEDQILNVNWDQFWTNKQFRDRLWEANLSYRQIMEDYKNKFDTELGSQLLDKYKNDLQNEDVRSYIGKYKIKKDKIISGHGYHKEFICNYEDVEMISYEVVDIKKIMADRGIHDDAEDIDWRTH